MTIQAANTTVDVKYSKTFVEALRSRVAASNSYEMPGGFLARVNSDDRSASAGNAVIV